MNNLDKSTVRETGVVVTAIVTLLLAAVFIGTGGTVMADSVRAAGKTAGLGSTDLKKVMLAATASRPVASKKKAKQKKRRVDDFDHLLTGFSLFGAHVNVECESCHVKGIFRGTPTTCQACHGHPGSIASTTKPLNHVTTTQPCDFCHNTSVWAGARFDHGTVAPGSCVRCHNGSIAAGKPAAGHPATTESCEACHAIGGSWLPAMFRHAGVAPGTCLSCHCVTATCKPGGHLVTTQSCDACHTMNAWVPATSGHGSGVAPGTCKTCHTYPGGHFFIKTQPQCDDCHYDNNWKPLRSYTHLAVSNHSSSVNSNCENCHKSNTDDATWPYATYKPNCAGCHRDKWKADPHDKYGGVKYTLDELQDCTTSCHVYSDATLTPPPTKSRPGRHTITNWRF